MHSSLLQLIYRKPKHKRKTEGKIFLKIWHPHSFPLGKLIFSFYFQWYLLQGLRLPVSCQFFLPALKWSTPEEQTMLLCRRLHFSVSYRVFNDAVKARHPRNQIKWIVTLSEKWDYASMGFQSPPTERLSEIRPSSDYTQLLSCLMLSQFSYVEGKPWWHGITINLNTSYKVESLKSHLQTLFFWAYTQTFLLIWRELCGLN